MNGAEQKLSFQYIEYGNEEPIEQEDLLEFTLLYEGPVYASGNRKTHTAAKHEIRRAIHPQLRRLWNTHSSLRQLAANIGHQANPRQGATEEERFAAGIAAIGQQWSRLGFQFVPLVTQEHALRCAVNITLFRPEESRYIMNSGDIDGRLKTVFDALRLPDYLAEADGMGPQEDETPFFCLLADDKLISEVRVSTEQLLLLPGHRELKANDTFLIVHVELNYRTTRTFDNYFG